jgi:hypothetical protein
MVDQKWKRHGIGMGKKSNKNMKNTKKNKKKMQKTRKTPFLTKIANTRHWYGEKKAKTSKNT